MKSILRTTGRMAVLLSVSGLALACSKDDAGMQPSAGDGIRFTARASNTWSDGNAPAVAGARGAVERTKGPVLAFEGKAPSDSLFLHLSVENRIVPRVPGETEEEGVPATRATKITTENFEQLCSAFGMYAFVFDGAWETGLFPNLMSNIPARKENNYWTPGSRHYWPRQGNVRIFAYAPYRAQGASLSGVSQAGAPRITYLVPDSPAQQTDLLVAAPEVFGHDYYSTSPLVPLQFRHICTAVEFVIDPALAQYGSVSKITLKGIHAGGTFQMDGSSWSLSDRLSDFSQTLEASAAPELMMMMPQTLPPGAALEVTMRDRATSVEYTLTASLAGREFPIGRTVICRISASSVDIDPVFEVEGPDDYTYLGGTGVYKVSSYMNVATSASSSVQPLAWTAEFVEGDEDAGYTVIPRPAWVGDITLSGEGTSEVKAVSFNAVARAQTETEIRSHDDDIRNAPAVSGTYDLSTEGGSRAMTTANTYLVNAAGRYRLPLVYGNAVVQGQDNGSSYHSSLSGSTYLSDFLDHQGNPISQPYVSDGWTGGAYRAGDCTLVWQDTPDLVSDVSLSDDRRYLEFTVASGNTLKQGNAVVAVRDQDGVIMWSWQIWVTYYKAGEDLKVGTTPDGERFEFMPINLGWCGDDYTSYVPRSVKVRFTQAQTGATRVITLRQNGHEELSTGNCPYYQWGRKDPIRAVMGNAAGQDTKNKAYYSGQDIYMYDMTGVDMTSLEETIRTPWQFNRHQHKDEEGDENYIYFNLWAAEGDRNYAGSKAVKTVYDPSPVGYIVPVYRAYSCFISEKSDSPEDVQGEYLSALPGWNFLCSDQNGQPDSVYFPFMGWREPFYAQVQYVRMAGLYWTASSAVLREGIVPYLEESSVALWTDQNTSKGIVVRCVRE